MTKNPSKNKFTGSTYKDILNPKLGAVYSGYVYYIENNYLRKQSGGSKTT